MRTPKDPNEKNQKADKTRQRILDVALGLFLKHGYEKATMREIANAAGLAPGAAYYHFDSKEHLIQAYYERSYEEHLIIVDKVLEKEKDLKKRLAGAVKAHMQIAESYHGISKALFATAVDPDHPLSPFSPESKEVRDKNIAVFKRVLEGTSTPIPEKLKVRLPEILWMFKMGMILYWVYDKSPRQRKTFQLIDQSSILIARLIQLSNLPILKGFSEQFVRMFYKYKFY